MSANKKSFKSLSIFGKYFSILIPVALLLVLIAGVAIFNYFASAKQDQTITDLNLAGRQAELTEEIAKDVMALHLQIVSPDEGYTETTMQESLSLVVDKLQHSTQIFDQTLSAFLQGGQVTNVDGKNIEIAAIGSNAAQRDLQSIQRMWVPFRQLIEAFNQSVRNGTIDKQAIFFASDYAQRFEGRLYNELAGLNRLLAAQAQSQTEFTQLVSAIVVLVAFILFFYIVLVALRRLVKSDVALALSRRETTDIMHTVQEGLFLIDDDLKVGQQTSDRLAQIVPGHTFSGENLEEILRKIVSANEIENTRRFIKQLFNERIDEYLMRDLNPLQRVVIHAEEDGEMKLHYVRFIFTRVWEQDSIRRVLVSVTDITEEVLLEQRLEKERIQNEQQVDLLMRILKISPPLLASFLRNARQLTERVNEVLRRRDQSTAGLKEKARQIFRDVHSFKGEASALELDRFVENCETIEERLKVVQQKSKISGNDFIQVTISLNDLIERISEMENMQINMQHMSSNSEKSSVREEMIHYYQRFTQGVAERNHKAAEIEISDYDIDQLDEHVHDQIKEMIVQFIRNAVVHGIEPKSVRESLHKPAIGRLRLSLKKDAQGYTLRFADDGAGLNYADLREKAKKLPQYADRPEEIDNMPLRELSRFIFSSGISTAKKSSSDAGRGVGMDVIRDRLLALKGRISLKSKEKVGTEFVLYFPSNLNQE